MRLLRDCRSRLRRAPRRLLRWIDPLAGTDQARYKSAKEIALENAADSLGTKLGDYYPQDWEMPDQPAVASTEDLPADVLARGRAAREEILVYADRVRARRRRRRSVRRMRIALLAVPIALVLTAVLVPALSVVGDPSQSGRAPKRHHGGKPPLSGPSGPLAREQQPAPFADALSLKAPGTASTLIASTYLNLRGKSCASLAKSAAGVTERRASGGCISQGQLREILASECVMVLGGSAGLGERSVIVGLAHEDVLDIIGRAPRGYAPLRVRLSKVWLPSAPGVDVGSMKPLRLFLVTAGYRRIRVTPNGPDGTDYLNPYAYKLTAKLSSGRSQVIKGLLPDQLAKGPGCG